MYLAVLLQQEVNPIQSFLKITGLVVLIQLEININLALLFFHKKLDIVDCFFTGGNLAPSMKRPFKLM